MEGEKYDKALKLKKRDWNNLKYYFSCVTVWWATLRGFHSFSPGLTWSFNSPNNSWSRAVLTRSEPGTHFAQLTSSTMPQPASVCRPRATITPTPPSLPLVAVRPLTGRRPRGSPDSAQCSQCPPNWERIEPTRLSLSLPPPAPAESGFAKQGKPGTTHHSRGRSLCSFCLGGASFWTLQVSHERLWMGCIDKREQC